MNATAKKLKNLLTEYKTFTVESCEKNSNLTDNFLVFSFRLSNGDDETNHKSFTIEKQDLFKIVSELTGTQYDFEIQDVNFENYEINDIKDIEIIEKGYATVYSMTFRSSEDLQEEYIGKTQTIVNEDTFLHFFKEIFEDLITNTTTEEENLDRLKSLLKSGCGFVHCGICPPTLCIKNINEYGNETMEVFEFTEEFYQENSELRKIMGEV